MRIAMIGATGLVGRGLATRLARAHRLLLVGRRGAGIEGAEERIAPVVKWPGLLAGERVDIAISTLGTTWKQAGSWNSFRAVDVEAVLAFARSAKAAGARQLLSVSSVGAIPGARNPYLAMKGEAERGLVQCGFKRLDIIRPGLLRGDRGTDRRVGERFAIAISPLANFVLRGSFDRYAAIDADLVAAAMASLVGAIGDGHHVHFNRDLKRLAGACGS